MNSQSYNLQTNCNTQDNLFKFKCHPNHLGWIHLLGIKFVSSTPWEVFSSFFSFPIEKSTAPTLKMISLSTKQWFPLTRSKVLLSLVLSFGCSPQFQWKTSPLSPDAQNVKCYEETKNFNEIAPLKKAMIQRPKKKKNTESATNPAAQYQSHDPHLTV